MTVTEQLSTLDGILAHGDITTLFQPIVSLSGRSILGYEALTRGAVKHLPALPRSTCSPRPAMPGASTSSR